MRNARVYLGSPSADFTMRALDPRDKREIVFASRCASAVCFFAAWKWSQKTESRGKIEVKIWRIIGGDRRTGTGGKCFPWTWQASPRGICYCYSQHGGYLLSGSCLLSPLGQWKRDRSQKPAPPAARQLISRSIDQRSREFTVSVLFGSNCWRALPIAFVPSEKLIGTFGVLLQNRRSTCNRRPLKKHESKQRQPLRATFSRIHCQMLRWIYPFRDTRYTSVNDRAARSPPRHAALRAQCNYGECQ